jgi:hypothetical protein
MIYTKQICVRWLYYRLGEKPSLRQIDLDKGCTLRVSSRMMSAAIENLIMVGKP